MKLKRELQWWWYKQLCHLENRPFQEMFYDIELIKPNGKIVDKVHGRAESYVRNFYNFLAQNMLQVQPSTYSHGAYGDGSLAIKTTAPADVTTQARFSDYTSFQSVEDLYVLNDEVGVRASSGLDGSGIIFDASDTAYTYEQTAPVSSIANGTGAGQLVYGDTFTPYKTYDSGDDKWTCIWERMALNNTAVPASVDVKSICLIMGFATLASGTQQKAMIARDVLVSTITVPYGIQIKGRWTLTHER